MSTNVSEVPVYTKLIFTATTAAIGSLTFASNPAASNIVIAGTTWSFVASGATGNQSNLGGTLALTLAALATALNASADVNIVKNTYLASATALIIINKTQGTSGNALTLTAGTSGATASGATLANGGTLNLIFNSAIISQGNPTNSDPLALAALYARQQNYAGTTWFDIYMPLAGGGSYTISNRINYGLRLEGSGTLG